MSCPFVRCVTDRPVDESRWAGGWVVVCALTERAPGCSPPCPSRRAMPCSPPSKDLCCSPSLPTPWLVGLSISESAAGMLLVSLARHFGEEVGPVPHPAPGRPLSPCISYTPSDRLELGLVCPQAQPRIHTVRALPSSSVIHTLTSKQKSYSCSSHHNSGLNFSCPSPQSDPGRVIGAGWQWFGVSSTLSPQTTWYHDLGTDQALTVPVQVPVHISPGLSVSLVCRASVIITRPGPAWPCASCGLRGPWCGWGPSGT